MSVKFLFIQILIFFTIQSSTAQNIQITQIGNPVEPSIMMDPKNPDILVAGANLNYYYTSDDGGKTWKTKLLKSSYGVWGDPVIDVDTSGNFYFTHLANTPNANWIDRIVCQKSTDQGKTWSDGSYTGLNGAKNQDKQWTVVDRNNNNIYMTWTEFDKYSSTAASDKSRILFSKSLDQGETWSTPVKISHTTGNCVDGDSSLGGAVPAVGASGEIYVAWASPDGILFNKSNDQGTTWLTKEILIDSMPGGWNLDIPGLDRANGFPILKCDLSGGDNHGTLYINWSDQRNGVNNTDIWFSKSKDGGYTWSKPVTVNDDGFQKHQFFTWMDIDQTNGNLFFVFYDRRAHEDNQTDVYMAISTDGGNSFINRRISETPFTPTTGVFFGDYNNIVAHNNIVRPIWTRHDGSRLSVWTDITPLDRTLGAPDEITTTSSNGVSIMPNPTSHLHYVSFKLHDESMVKLELFDAKGSPIKVLVNNVLLEYGSHIVPIDTQLLNLSSGTYYYQLSINGSVKTIKTLVME